MNRVVALLGECEKGRFHYPHFCKSLIELADTFGNPPENSQGLLFAIQAILYERDVIFFRVEEEGYNIQDYMLSFELLKNKNKIKKLDAICLPGVGNNEIISKLDPICEMYSSIIITTEKDLFDYLISI